MPSQHMSSHLGLRAGVLEQVDLAEVIGHSDHLPVMRAHQGVDVRPIRPFWPDPWTWETQLRQCEPENVTVVLPCCVEPSVFDRAANALTSLHGSVSENGFGPKV